ncbi:MAG: BPL-N domain-containing protein [Thermoleophilia bacterium]|jgi:glutamine amidotransferase-like uncharacterized protein|nr:BPL-N domain-containing protein [Thermoleophilia bacterium]
MDRHTFPTVTTERPARWATTALFAATIAVVILAIGVLTLTAEVVAPADAQAALTPAAEAPAADASIAHVPAVSAQAAEGPVRVAVYVGGGTSADKIAATLRACQACGFDFTGIELEDLVMGRLSTADYDVLLLPAGQDDTKVVYGNEEYGLGSAAAIGAIRAFVSAGGGIVGLESGGAYLSRDGGLKVYPGKYRRFGKAGKNDVTITDPTFGSGKQQVYRTAGGGWLMVKSGATEVAANAAGQAVIARCGYGAGRVVVCTLDPELRGDTQLDWSIWDDWAMDGRHTDSAGAWKLLGRMVNWAGTGVATQPALTEHPNPDGARVAIVSTYSTHGGAWPGLLPAVSRAVEYSGHVPLAVRGSDIRNGRLTDEAFDVVVFPGGYCWGYETALGAKGGLEVKSFCRAGGGVMGICAGSYYLSETIDYYGETFLYLSLFEGVAVGELDDIAQYPHAALTPTYTSDPVIGDLGAMQVYYAGGPFFTQLEASNASVVTTYAYDGTYAGAPDVIRFTYGQGHVLLTGTHPEVRTGSDVDWISWDDYHEGTNVPWVNPDNPWRFFDAAMDNWLTK